VLAAALTILAGVVVAWALTTAADRVPVLTVARPIAAGDVISADDLAVADVAFDSAVNGLVPAASRDELVGRVATIALQPGTLLTVGMWADVPGLAEGERSVGASLPRGRFPSGIATGDGAIAVATDSDAPAVTVRVIDVIATDDGAITVTLAVAEADAAGVARMAAAGGLALVGTP
jgi:hypothetical protein